MPFTLGSGELALLVGLLALYFLPSIVAAARGVGTGTTMLVNALLAWTGIGWLVMLLWAATARPRSVAKA